MQQTLRSECECDSLRPLLKLNWFIPSSIMAGLFVVRHTLSRLIESPSFAMQVCKAEDSRWPWLFEWCLWVKHPQKWQWSGGLNRHDNLRLSEFKCKRCWSCSRIFLSTADCSLETSKRHIIMAPTVRYMSLFSEIIKGWDCVHCKQMQSDTINAKKRALS